jgi:hypothetical protein
MKVFSKYFGFSCQSFYRLLHIHYHPSSGAGKIGQIMADVPSGLNLTPPQEIGVPPRKLPVGVMRVGAFDTAEQIRRGLTPQSDA